MTRAHFFDPQDDREIIQVLIVEDDPDDVYLIKDMLADYSRHDYVFTHVESLTDAQELLLENQYDAILLDLGLPDSEGLASLHVLIHIASSPIIVLTGANSEELGEQAIKEGAEDYLPKQMATPFLLTRSINHSIERFRLKEELAKRAQEDPLTGLPNRSMIYDKLEFWISQCERSCQRFSLVMMDFDKFKEINDTKGHRYGDALLRAFAERLIAIMRKSDYIARFGGDEFLMIMSNYQDKAELESILKEKYDVLTEPYDIEIDGVSVKQPLSISFGVMLWEPGITAGKMLERADQAMYSSKHNSRDVITFYQ